MKLKSVWEKVPLKKYVYLALGINTLTLVFIFLTRIFLPPEVPLFYGNALGDMQLVKTLFLTVAPLVSLVILFANIFFSYFTDDTFLKSVLIISSFFISILTCITVFRIIFLVGFF